MRFLDVSIQQNHTPTHPLQTKGMYCDFNLGFHIIAVNRTRAMAGNCPYFPKLAFKKPGEIIYEKIPSSSVN